MSATAVIPIDPGTAPETAEAFRHAKASLAASSHAHGSGSTGDRSPKSEPGLSLSQLISMHPDPNQTLLGNRFLCRSGAMLFVGPSGIGKSSASMHMDLCWACGRAAFGITPAAPLLVLTIQAENDVGDLHEMAAGAIDALDLTEAEGQLAEANFRIIRHQTSVGLNFIVWLAVQLEEHRPDLVRIDPLLAYLGADPTDTKAIAEFCRVGLNPLLLKYNCGAIVNHHTPKTNGRDTSEWKSSDWMYAGSGAAGLTNWVRAILVVDPTKDPRTFRFIAAKRGRRVGWLDRDENPVQERHFSHALEADRIAWIDTPDEIADELKPRSKRRPLPTPEEFIGLLPPPEMENPEAALVTMAELESRALAKTFTKNGLAGIRDQLERERRIFVTRGKGRNRAILIGRPEIEHLVEPKNQRSAP